jgi:hypothetical protein
MSTKTHTTIEAGKVMSACPDDERLDLRGVVILDNESGNVQVTLTEDELEEYQRETRSAINDDVISDDAINELVEWLDAEELLESWSPTIPSPFPVKPIGTHEPSLSPEENRRQDIIELAREQHCSSYEHGHPEIDDDAKVSEGGDNGAYVQAWVWVSFEDTPLDKGETDADRFINHHLQSKSGLAG